MNFLIKFKLIFLIIFVSFSFSFQNEIYWNQKQILISNDGKQFDNFGSSISLSNDGKYCLIGAYNSDVGNNTKQGKAYIFQNNGTYWNQIQILIANDGKVDDQFGSSVSISNDKKYCIVGAYEAIVGSNYQQGKAYIFENNGTFWNQKQILIANDGKSNDEFGSSISISNNSNFILISSPNSQIGNNTKQGKAYIFQNNGTFWNQIQILIPNDAQQFEFFGSSVSISNDEKYCLIGAYHSTVNGNEMQGKAYIFQNNGTFWNQTQILIASDGKYGDTFGSSISISNNSNLILISSPNSQIGNNTNQGKAYIFQNNGTFWNQYQILIANDGESNEFFGSTVSLSNDGKYCLIGSPYAKVNENFVQGKAYIFQNNGTFWNQKQILIANDGEAYDKFGTSVSISENYSLIGSPQASVSNNSYQGKVYFFDLYSNPNPKPNPNSNSNLNSKIIISIIIILIILIGIILIILLIRKRKRNQNQNQYQKEKEKEEILMNNPLFSDNGDGEDEF